MLGSPFIIEKCYPEPQHCEQMWPAPFSSHFTLSCKTISHILDGLTEKGKEKCARASLEP